MNREETLAIMGALKAAYPTFYRDMRREEAEQIVRLWTEMFADDPAREVAAAVKAHIATDAKGFPPHIGAIKTSLCKLRAPDELTEAEAWGCVRRALKNGIYGYMEEYEKLPAVVQRLVGSPSQLKEWAMMDEDTVASVVASNFQRSYKARAASEREYMALPQGIRDQVALVAEHFEMPASPGSKE